MNTSKIMTPPRTAFLALSLILAVAGCKNQPSVDDTTLTLKAQSSITADQNLAGQTIQASASTGVVTLNGAVTSDAARTIAKQDISQIPGVTRVVDNLVVQASVPSATAVAPPPAPVAPVSISAPAKVGKPSAAVSKATPPPAPAPIVRPVPAPAPVQQPYQPAVAQVQTPPPPPAPVVHSITLPAGTGLPVRITQTLDSATTQTGDKFTGVIATDIIIDNLVVLPQGTSVTGHVDAAQDAAHFKGSSMLTISLSAINRKGEHIDVATEPYTKEGEGRGKNTAEKVGGGAAVGAILGGIFGGGKGAAIGAAAGGGVGAGAQGITRGQQVQIPSETVVRFKLSDSIIVRVTTGGGTASAGALEHRGDQ